jgi:hypothetical protein
MANESDWISASTSTHFADYGSPVTLPANTGVVAVARFVIFSFIVALLLIGNALTLWAIATTDRLRDKAYSLTTSLSATDFVLGIVVSNYIVHESMTSTPCDMATYKSIARPLERMALYASFLHVSPDHHRQVRRRRVSIPVRKPDDPERDPTRRRRHLDDRRGFLTASVRRLSVGRQAVVVHRDVLAGVRVLRGVLRILLEHGDRCRCLL